MNDQQQSSIINGQAVSGIIGIAALLLIVMALYKGFTGKNISL